MIEIPKNWADLPEDEVFLFYSHKGWILSNFAAVSFFYNGKFWPTAEHAYQAAKFKGDYHDSTETVVHHMVYQAPDPLAAKRLANEERFAEYIRSDWEIIKPQTMLDIKRAQAKSSPNLMSAIIEFSKCGKVWLVEDSSKDAFWGRGEDWCGQNMLGIIYMIIYQEHEDPRFSELRDQLGLK